MTKTPHAPPTDSELVGQTEELLWQILNHEPPFDASFPPMPALAGDATSADRQKAAEEQDNARRANMEPRAEAVAGLRGTLLALWNVGLRRLTHRHIDDVHGSEWLCAESPNTHRSGCALASVCRFGCAGCVEAALAELKLVGDGVREAAASAARAGVRSVPMDRRLAKKDGSPREPIRRLLMALPGAADQTADPRSWEVIAKAARTSAAVARSLSQALQDEALVVRDDAGTWRRSLKADAWLDGRRLDGVAVCTDS